MRIGILALQGGYEAHGRVFQRLGVAYDYVRDAADFANIDGLVIPGGESSTLIHLIKTRQLTQCFLDFHQQGKPLWGTCAGCILLAKTVAPAQFSLGFIDITVTRNGYGRQCDSFIDVAELAGETVELIFIRAPIISQLGDQVQSLLDHRQQTIMAQQGNVLVTTFHPELTSQTTVHQYFTKLVLSTVEQQNVNGAVVT